MLSAGIGILLALGCGLAQAATEFPPLPTENSAATLPAQEWPFEPGPRSIEAYVYYPTGHRDGVSEGTGLMLTLHNWGGTKARGAPDPETLAETFNVVAIAVDYLQSGPYDSDVDPPYDFGLYQGLDALRALYWVYAGLQASGIYFDTQRLYATGGSGGGNVSLMANKLAPRTFAAVIDLSGMARLSDDIAFNLPGGSTLNAGYSRDANSPRYVSPAAQRMRDPGWPPHLAAMGALGTEALIVSIHGAEDSTCPFEDKVAMVSAMDQAGLEVNAHFVYGAESPFPEVPSYIRQHRSGDGPFKNAGHGLGDRTAILLHLAGPLLDPANPASHRRQGISDFDRRDTAVVYSDPDGVYVVDYRLGFPQLQWTDAKNERDER